MTPRMSRNDTVRAAIYVRISQDEDDDKKGVVRHQADCRDICAERGWHVIEPIFEDNDITASKGKQRQQYERLLADINAGRVQAVVTMDQDRFTRTPIEREEFSSVAWRAGIPYLSTITSGDIPLGPDADMTMARVRSAFAAEESHKIGLRVMRKKQELGERGLPAGGGIRAFGYNWVHRIKGTNECYVEPDAAAEPYSIHEPEARTMGLQPPSASGAPLRDYPRAFPSPLVQEPLSARSRVVGAEGRLPRCRQLATVTVIAALVPLTPPEYEATLRSA